MGDSLCLSCDTQGFTWQGLKAGRMLGAWRRLQAPSPTCVVTYADGWLRSQLGHQPGIGTQPLWGPFGSFTVGVTRFLESKGR